MAIRRDSKLVRGLVDWLLGGISARLDFLEQDVQEVRRDSRQQQQNQQVLAQQVVSHQQQLEHQAKEMIAVKKMRMLLADKLNREFPGRLCEACGSPMIFRRQVDQKAYSLTCPNQCGKTLILPETMILNAFRQLPPPPES